MNGFHGCLLPKNRLARSATYRLVFQVHDVVWIGMRFGNPEIGAPDDFKPRFLVKANCPVIFLPGKKPHPGLMGGFGKFNVKLEQIFPQFQIIKLPQDVQSFQFGDSCIFYQGVSAVEDYFGVANCLVFKENGVKNMLFVVQFPLKRTQGILHVEVGPDISGGGAVSMRFQKGFCAEVDEQRGVCGRGFLNRYHVFDC